jgi:hypothetical protein
MSLVLAAALAASTATVPVCSWDRPGRNVFQGDVVSAVDRYADIPPDVRERLKKRMAEYRYDEVATIRRDTIEGRHAYTDLRDMHFGQGQLCRSVTRDKWAAGAEERGLVYCDSGHCLIVPTVCRNLSRVTRGPAQAPLVAEAPAGTGQLGALPPVAASEDELLFDPTAAGRRPSDSPQSFASAAESPPPAAGIGSPIYGGGGTPDFIGAAAPAIGIGNPAGAGSSPGVSGPPGGGGLGDPDLTPSGPPIDPTAPIGIGNPGGFPLPGAPLPAVPEPSGFALFAAGLAALAFGVRRRRNAR